LLGDILSAYDQNVCRKRFVPGGAVILSTEFGPDIKKWGSKASAEKKQKKEGGGPLFF
jgi:hypothetical protein